jgi:hypothetical protein
MKKTSFTKILLSTTVLGLIALSSCKKDSNSPSTGYYVKFKLDGTEKQYSEIATAVFTTQLPLYQCAMVGEKQTNGTVYEGMGITINNSGSIAANLTYTDELVSGLGTPQAILLFTDDAGAQASSGFATSPNVKVTITQMDDKTVTGTFSGTIESTTDMSTTHTVTEGEFHLSRM